MARMLRVLGSLAVAGLIVAGPLLYRDARVREWRNFREAEPGVLYRSGQLDRDSLRRAVAEYGIKSVVSFRFADDPDSSPPDIDEELFCRENGIGYFRIRPREWSSPDGVPAADSVAEFRELFHGPLTLPVLIHCYAGMHRTGTFCAVFRMEECGWTAEEAIREMIECGYSNLKSEWDVYRYIREYEPAGPLSP